MSDILSRAEAILTNARSEWAVRDMQAEYALSILSDLVAEIKQLEDALVEERAKRILSLEPEEKFDLVDRTECPRHNEGCDEECYLERCPSAVFWLGVAREQLRAEGVIR